MALSKRKFTPTKVKMHSYLMIFSSNFPKLPHFVLAMPLITYDLRLILEIKFTCQINMNLDIIIWIGFIR